jgi:NAD(P)-dependent dehydrogenase (short-subunit alcohol dehydrogenase family)
MSGLNGYNVLITGATGGLGRALSTAFWNAGANLLLAGRSPARLNDLSESLAPNGRQTLELIDCDLAQPDGAANLVGFVRGRWEWLDTLVNNAGILGPVGPAWENDWDAWEATVRMNLLVPVQLCRGLIPMMGRRGSIINISGGGATSPRPNFTAYGASKAALARFSETLAVECASRGIRVNCIAPGIMRTRMVQQVVTIGADRSGPQEFHKAQEVMERGGTSPETPAELALLLASEGSKSITGKVISAAWDPWRELPDHAVELANSDIYTLRRIVPADRGMKWSAHQ